MALPKTLFSRRRLIAGTALAAPALLLGACTFGKNGTVDTGTLNVTQMVNYLTAAENAATLLLVLPAISGPLGIAGVAAANVVLGTLKAALTAFEAAAGTSIEVSIDTATVKSAVDSGLAAMESLLTQFQGVVASIVPGQATAAVITQVTTYVDALQTIVSLAEALIPASSGTVTASYATPTMTETQALAVLRVR